MEGVDSLDGQDDRALGDLNKKKGRELVTGLTKAGESKPGTNLTGYIFITPWLILKPMKLDLSVAPYRRSGAFISAHCSTMD